MTLFCLKRLLIAFVTASLRDPISISILVYTKLSLFTIGYTINHKPFTRKSHNLNEILNEWFLLMTGYYLFIFSDWIYDPRPSSSGEYSHDPITKYNFGYSYIVMVVIIISLNMSIVVYELYKSSIKAY